MHRLFALTLFLFLFVLPLSSGMADDNELPAMPDLLSDELAYDDDGYSADDAVGGRARPSINDPLEPMNRLFFQVNDRLYYWLLKPVADGYAWLLPRELRLCFGNFFTNLTAPIQLANALLQFDLKNSGVVLARFTLNSTLGVYGLVDVAESEFKLPAKRTDFGQTLGKWGVGEGVYIYWPVFGPSNVRDTIGMAVETYAHPVPYLQDDRLFTTTFFGTDMVNYLSLHPELYEDLMLYSIDPYVSARQAYFEYRRNLIEKP